MGTAPWGRSAFTGTAPWRDLLPQALQWRDLLSQALHLGKICIPGHCTLIRSACTGTAPLQGLHSQALLLSKVCIHRMHIAFSASSGTWQSHWSTLQHTFWLQSQVFLYSVLNMGLSGAATCTAAPATQHPGRQSTAGTCKQQSHLHINPLEASAVRCGLCSLIQGSSSAFDPTQKHLCTGMHLAFPQHQGTSDQRFVNLLFAIPWKGAHTMRKLSATGFDFSHHKKLIWGVQMYPQD